ncbi:hypothetical protein EAE91_17450 [Photorhabdus noenieputensis]|uniref:hypothetical protein n=1 Tax=Photorhabdus noenieputensis TaxID=1208607 RepID=UPI001BD3146F|nr:hypothetical protein [Photorhabdus noenieputensis]MBS9438863.1 hypothetical protein [Photorhabdus noenieputensis]MCK3668816.1 hypothetical protein [Photorhabdus noenieputensis]
MLMIFVTVLWGVIRWISLSFYHVLSWLLRRRPVRLPAAHARRLTVYAGKWQLSDDAKSCGRPVVVRDRHSYKPGVELLYFGEESPEPFYGERYLIDETEAVDSAQQMLTRLLRQRSLSKAYDEAA